MTIAGLVLCALSGFFGHWAHDSHSAYGALGCLILACAGGIFIGVGA